jgi:hypothetical protein
LLSRYYILFILLIRWLLTLKLILFRLFNLGFHIWIVHGSIFFRWNHLMIENLGHYSIVSLISNLCNFRMRLEWERLLLVLRWHYLLSKNTPHVILWIFINISSRLVILVIWSYRIAIEILIERFKHLSPLSLVSRWMKPRSIWILQIDRSLFCHFSIFQVYLVLLAFG